MLRLLNPLPIWLDQAGALLDAGSIYIGTPGDDPEVSPVTVYWDAALTIPAVQPLRTRGGVIVNNGSPAAVFIAGSDYSTRVRDADGNLVAFTPTATNTAAASYQPLDADLTAIAALATTAFGRSVLTVADAAALRALAGIIAALPLAGGTVTGNILRGGAGPHLFFADNTYVSGKVFVTANGAADPTTAIGDIWLELEP